MLNDKDMEILNEGFNKKWLWHYRDMLYRLTGEKISVEGCNKCIARSMYNKILKKIKNYG